MTNVLGWPTCWPHARRTERWCGSCSCRHCQLHAGKKRAAEQCRSRAQLGQVSKAPKTCCPSTPQTKVSRSSRALPSSAPCNLREAQTMPCCKDPVQVTVAVLFLVCNKHMALLSYGYL